MAIGKMLKLGGIDNSPPKTDQSVGRFRVARNVQPTPDGRLIPRYSCASQTSPDQLKTFHAFSNYNNSPLYSVSRFNTTTSLWDIQYFKNATFIPFSCSTPSSPYQHSINNPQASMTYRRNDTAYFLNPIDTNGNTTYTTMMKYDGVEMSYTGAQQPKIGSPDFGSGGGGTQRFVKVCQHKKDFDGTEPWSEPVGFYTTLTTTSVRIQVDTNLTTNLVKIWGGFDMQVSPTSVINPSIAGDNYYKSVLAGVWSGGNQDLTFSEASSRSGTGNNTVNISGISSTADLIVGMSVTGSGIPAGTTIVTITGANSIKLSAVCTTVGSVTLSFPIDTNMKDDSRLGSYVVVAEGYTSSSAAGISGFSEPTYGIALRLKSYTSTSITLDGTNIKYLTRQREWKTGTLTGLGSSITSWRQGSRNFVSVWASPTQYGVYYLRGFEMAFPDSSYYSEITVDIPSTPSASIGIEDFQIVNLGSQLNSVFDDTSRKFSLNSDWNYGGYFYGMTVFQDQLLMINEDYIFISDSSSGGSFETFTAINFIKVGDMQYGRMTSICATEDFLIVSRERKNYYITGNIATGNYTVQEITDCEIGAWGNDSTVNVRETVFMLTAQGIYQITKGGRATVISEKCPKNFATYDNISVNEDVVFRITGFNSSLDYTDSTQRITSAYDEYRDLLVFMMRGVSNSPCLVVHTKSGETYEWDGFISDANNREIDCIAFIQGKYYIGQKYLAGASPAVYMKEDNTASLSYVTSNPVKLYSTWISNGEPSLEKILLQLKLFGRFQSNGSTNSINVCHYKDWDISTKITNSTYFPNDTSLSLNNQIQYSHKKRLNSDKVLAASVGFEVNNAGVLFELDSMEIEMNSIQEGMKK